jgi:hypothetical protein
VAAAPSGGSGEPAALTKEHPVARYLVLYRPDTAAAEQMAAATPEQ